jgi:hypothetical protein
MDVRGYGSGNLTLINTLESLTQRSQNEFTCLLAARILGKIDPSNSIAIMRLEWLAQNCEDEYKSFLAASNLEVIHPGNTIAINALVRLAQNVRMNISVG